jgi:hypothetical protein
MNTMTIVSRDPADKKQYSLIRVPIDAAVGCKTILENLRSAEYTIPSRDKQECGITCTRYEIDEKSAFVLEGRILKDHHKATIPSHPAAIIIHQWVAQGARKELWMIERINHTQSERVKLYERHFLIQDTGEKPHLQYADSVDPRCKIGSNAHIDSTSIWIQDADGSTTYFVGRDNPMWPWAAFYPDQFQALAALRQLHDLQNNNALKALSKDSNASTRYIAERHAMDARKLIDKVVVDIIRTL